ncbi:MAG: DoxX family membrane protein [Propionibacteriaceae bacterium]|jgi:uncharacterized membrane protein YphA (DoxX/SURF4 family)|nr:DoxX family membrane protein [Propionibacteriaceae bacterium]
MPSPHGASPWRDPFGWVSLACRLVLGVVLFWAGAAKLTDLEASVTAVRAFQILPFDLTRPVGYVLPVAEALIGAAIVIGLFTRWTALIGGLFMVAFIIGLASVWARGISIDCGCFGGGGAIAAEQALKQYPIDLARDAGLLATSAWLVWRPGRLASLDAWLFPPLDRPRTDQAA